MTTLDLDGGTAGGLLISLALAAAALLAILPQPGPALARAQSSVAAHDAGEPEAKFEDRLAAAPGEPALPERRLHLLAAVLMPMLVEWGTPAAERVLIASQAPRAMATGLGASQPVRQLPVARPATLVLSGVERQADPAPLPVKAAEMRQPRDEWGWAGLAIAANAFDRLTSTAVAAGSWAAGSTASLLPNWR